MFIFQDGQHGNGDKKIYGKGNGGGYGNLEYANQNERFPMKVESANNSHAGIQGRTKELIEKVRAMPVSKKALKNLMKEYDDPALWLTFNEEIHGDVFGYLNLGIPDKGYRDKESGKEVQAAGMSPMQDHHVNDSRLMVTYDIGAKFSRVQSISPYDVFVEHFKNRLSDDEMINVFLSRRDFMDEKDPDYVFHVFQDFMDTEKKCTFILPKVLEMMRSHSSWGENPDEKSEEESPYGKFISANAGILSQVLTKVHHYNKTGDKEQAHGVFDMASTSMVNYGVNKRIYPAQEIARLRPEFFYIEGLNECATLGCRFSREEQWFVAINELGKENSGVMLMLFDLYRAGELGFDALHGLSKINWEHAQEKKTLAYSINYLDIAKEKYLSRILGDDALIGRMLTDSGSKEKFFIFFKDIMGIEHIKNAIESDYYKSSLGDHQSLLEKMQKELGESYKRVKEKMDLVKLVGDNAPTPTTTEKAIRHKKSI